MDFILPILFFLIPILIAFKLCEWQVVAAFLVGVVLVPFLMISLFHLYEVYFMSKTLDFKGALSISAMFSVFGLPIYLIIVLPFYYFLQTLQFPIHYSFPILISIIMCILFVLITEREWGWKQIAVIILCSYVHSWFILWMIAKLKNIQFGD
ncbi:hypothetical protein ABWH96_16105 [Marivirga tractuosa]|uniref:hypothetical protein n=1 Tax=Marivirga tractuosa TaxID=1006 RepID=UPI0035CFF0E6